MFHNTCGRKGRFARTIGMALAVSITMSGCSTISDWFADDEELEIRRLKPIEAKFTPKLVWDRDIGDGVIITSLLRPVYNKLSLPIDMAPLSRGTLSRESVGEKDFTVSLDMLSSVTNFGVAVRLRIGGIAVADRHVFIGEKRYVAAMDAETGESCGMRGSGDFSGSGC